MMDPREIEAEIPAEWFMFASSEDHQQSNEVYNVGNTMNLPDPNGREGGACTAAFLQACYRDERDTSVDLSYVGILRGMREAMEDLGFEDQVSVFCVGIFFYFCLIIHPMLYPPYSFQRTPNFPAVARLMSTKLCTLFLLGVSATSVRF